MLVAIVACEIGFWVFLGAGLLTRYVLRRPRLGAVLLVCVPLVDVALLVLTGLDLRSGTQPDLSHGLAALYLGFSVAFGHSLVRWADVRAAHRFAGGPPPAASPRSGTWPRVRKEWKDFGLALLAAAVTVAVLAGLVLVAGPGVDTRPLLGFLPSMGVALTVWLLGWPVWETVRAAGSRRAG